MAMPCRWSTGDSPVRTRRLFSEHHPQPFAPRRTPDPGSPPGAARSIMVLDQRCETRAMMHDLISKPGIRDGARLLQVGLNFRVFALAMLLWVLGEAISANPVRAEYRVAPDVVVSCEPTLQHALSDLGAVWRKQSGIQVHIFASPTAALLEQVSHGARSDVLIGEGDSAAAGAGERHLIKPATLQRL